MAYFPWVHRLWYMCSFKNIAANLGWSLKRHWRSLVRCYSFAVRMTSSRSDRASKSGCPRGQRLGLGQRARALELGTPGFELRVWHFLVVQHGVRKVSNWFLRRLPSSSARCEDEYLSLEIAGGVKDLMCTTCLARNTHQVPRVYIPCCAFEHHCVRQDQKICYSWPIMFLRMGRIQQEALLTIFKLYFFSR